jgi:hypothetical protein
VDLEHSLVFWVYFRSRKNSWFACFIISMMIVEHYTGAPP